jgi:hypothetical protein
MLIGDIFKFSGWTMGYVILARSGSSMLFLTEVVGGGTTLLTSWLAMRWFGLTGLGVGYLVGYLAHFGIVSFVVRREIALVWTRQNLWMMLAALGAAGIIRALPLAGLTGFRTPVALLLAFAAAAYSITVISREVGGIRRVRFIR